MSILFECSQIRVDQFSIESTTSAKKVPTVDLYKSIVISGKLRSIAHDIQSTNGRVNRQPIADSLSKFTALHNPKLRRFCLLFALGRILEKAKVVFVQSP